MQATMDIGVLDVVLPVVAGILVIGLPICIAIWVIYRTLKDCAHVGTAG